MELNRIADSEEFPEAVRKRARAVALSAANVDHKEAGRVAGLGAAAVTTWVDRYNAEGPAGLADRPRSGRRGGEAVADLPARVLEVVSSEPPEGGWSAEAVADEIGVGVGSAREAAREAGVTFERARSWEFATADELAASDADVVGLYVSSLGRAVVVSAAPPGGAPPSPVSGSVTTRNGSLARDLARASARGPLSLAGALELAADHAADAVRIAAGRPTLADFVESCISGLAVVAGGTVTAVVTGGSPSAPSLLRHASLRVQAVAGDAEWEAAAEAVLRVGGGGSPGPLLASLSRYLSSRTDGTEPFRWSKAPAGATDREAGDAVAEADADAASVAAVADDTGAGSEAPRTPRGALARITVEYVSGDGESSSATVEVGGLPDSCDPGSAESLLGFVSGLEGGVSAAVDRATRLLCEAAVAAASKKNSGTR